ncbi:hypothetical protein AKJ16_DCAP12685 [Drosera capensis]
MVWNSSPFESPQTRTDEELAQWFGQILDGDNIQAAQFGALMQEFEINVDAAVSSMGFTTTAAVIRDEMGRSSISRDNSDAV